MGIQFQETSAVRAGEPVTCTFRLTGIFRLRPQTCKNLFMGIGPHNMDSHEDVFMAKEIRLPEHVDDVFFSIVFPAECLTLSLHHRNGRFCVMYKDGTILDRSRPFRIESYSQHDDEERDSDEEFAVFDFSDEDDDDNDDDDDGDDKDDDDDDDDDADDNDIDDDDEYDSDGDGGYDDDNEGDDGDKDRVCDDDVDEADDDGDDEDDDDGDDDDDSEDDDSDDDDNDYENSNDNDNGGWRRLRQWK